MTKIVKSNTPSGCPGFLRQPLCFLFCNPKGCSATNEKLVLLCNKYEMLNKEWGRLSSLDMLSQIRRITTHPSLFVLYTARRRMPGRRRARNLCFAIALDLRILPQSRIRSTGLAAARARSGSDSHLGCHSIPSRRFTTSRKEPLCYSCGKQLTC